MLIFSGICEPLNSTLCKEVNTWDVCGQVEKFECDFNAVKEDNGRVLLFMVNHDAYK